jgi:hypothetical protein
MDRWFEILMSVVSGASLVVLTLVLFILRDFKDRIMRLETNAMRGTGSAIAYRRVPGAVGQPG